MVAWRYAPRGEEFTGHASGSSTDLREPPAQAHEEKAPIAKELRRLSFNGVAHELKHPPGHEHRQRQPPHARDEQGDDKQGQRERDERYPDGVTEAVHRMFVAVSVLLDPDVPGFTTEQGYPPFDYCTFPCDSTTRRAA